MSGYIRAMDQVVEVLTSQELDPVAAWNEVGHRLIEIDPELFARVLSKMSRYVGTFDSHIEQTFDDAMMAAILLAGSQGCR